MIVINNNLPQSEIVHKIIHCCVNKGMTWKEFLNSIEIWGYNWNREEFGKLTPDEAVKASREYSFGR